MDDPLSDLAPFLQQARESKPEFSPPDYLTVRLMETRGGGIQPPVAPMPEEEPLPRPFGPYQLEKLLGRGGAGSVYRAYDPELERMVVLKMLSPAANLQREAGARFLREARAMAKLSHDHLMPLLAVHQDTPVPCYTMPLMEGQTLADRIRERGPLPLDEVVKFAKQISAGLVAAHDADLIHRDLKPDNIFLEETELGARARLMDFGLVKAAEDPSMTRVGEVAGSPSFMAPEQIDGLGVDGRADLYSLGATLFMAVTGKPPFEGKTLTATLRQVSAEEAPDLSKLDQAVPTWFSVLVSELLQKEPSLRPANARLVLVRLEEEKRAPTATGVRIQSGWLWGALVVAAFLGVLLWFATTVLREKEEKEEFDLEVAVASFQSGDVWRVPPGVHYLESVDLKGGDLTVEGTVEGARLVFVKLDGPAFRNAGNLELRNLTIDCSREGEGPTASLVSSQGERVVLSHCRIEQKQSSSLFPDRFVLIEAAADSTTRIVNCEFYTFQSITWRMRGKARLHVENSLVVSPGLVLAETSEESAGSVTLKQSTCISQIGFSHLVMEDGSEPIDFELERSLLECAHALLWLPLGDEEILQQTVSYRAKESLFLLPRKIVNTAPRPRVVNRRAGTLDQWGPVEWAEFWGERQEAVTVQEGSMIARQGVTGRVVKDFKASEVRVPAGFQDWGAPLEEVGPEGGLLE